MVVETVAPGAAHAAAVVVRIRMSYFTERVVEFETTIDALAAVVAAA